MQGDFFLTNWIMEGMRWVYSDITGGNIVLTIVICTILLKCITLFADVKSRKASLKMQAIQPELDRLRKKYENNPQKLQQQQNKLMRDNGVSMMGGCLPLLIMMPLFFMFIAAFRFWGNEMTVRMLLELNETPGKSQLFESFHFLWINNIWQADNGTVPVIMNAETFFATQNLEKLLYFQWNPDALKTFTELFPTQISNGSIVYTEAAIAKYNELVAPLLAQYQGVNNGWFILPILAGGSIFLSTWIQQRTTQKSTPTPEKGSGADAANSTSKTMMYVMPIISVIACLSATAAFGIYWVISSIVSIITNLIINKSLAKEAVTVAEVK